MRCSFVLSSFSANQSRSFSKKTIGDSLDMILGTNKRHLPSMRYCGSSKYGAQLLTIYKTNLDSSVSNVKCETIPMLFGNGAVSLCTVQINPFSFQPKLFILAPERANCLSGAFRKIFLAILYISLSQRGNSRQFLSITDSLLC